jgi:hypothetical protein
MEKYKELKALTTLLIQYESLLYKVDSILLHNNLYLDQRYLNSISYYQLLHRVHLLDRVVGDLEYDSYGN